MLALLRAGVEHAGGPFSLRYPRDVVPAAVPELSQIAPVQHATWEVLRRGSDPSTGSGQGVAILAVGTMVQTSLDAAERLAAEGLDVTVVNCRYLKPYDQVTLAAILADHRQILVVEEGTVVNGFGAFMTSVIARPLRLPAARCRICRPLPASPPRDPDAPRGVHPVSRAAKRRRSPRGDR